MFNANFSDFHKNSSNSLEVYKTENQIYFKSIYSLKQDRNNTTPYLHTFVNCIMLHPKKNNNKTNYEWLLC